MTELNGGKTSLSIFYGSFLCPFGKPKVKVNEGFPGRSVGKESAYNSVRPRFDPWVGKIP